MEEVILPDLNLSRTILSIGGKEYSFYCRRPNQAKAELIKSDLINQGFIAEIRLANNQYEIWWRKP